MAATGDQSEVGVKDPIKISSINFHIPENTRKQRTDKYDVTSNEDPELVVRRGAPFALTLQLDREYVNQSFGITLSYGKNPTSSNGTLAEITVEKNKKYGPKEWGANIASKTKDSVTLAVSVPATSFVGRWGLTAKTICQKEDQNGFTKSFEYDSKRNITVLFNPWCKDDVVYMPAEKELDEYVLNDYGAIFKGSAWYSRAYTWQLGQFETESLEASLVLLSEGLDGMSVDLWSDPVAVARRVAKLVNCADDNGVLWGRWDGNYKDGTSPLTWKGSVEILKQYLSNKKKPVKYGQCWVFAALTNTVCRSLGIATRIVTNFASAHDTDNSNTIDKYFARNPDGTRRKLDGGDSVWNFHVWNEVWMRRPDLDSMPDVKAGEFDGWQVIDATPQELSENLGKRQGGVYTCGPSPLAAIKKGNCLINYDTGFVFSEVNADEIHWEKGVDGANDKRIKVITNSVGQSISTKNPDGKSTLGRLTVTENYKFKEGSSEEAAAVMLAFKTAKKPKEGAYDDALEKELVKVKLQHGNGTMIGDNLDITVILENQSKQSREVTMVQLRLRNQTYTGAKGKVFYTKDLDKPTIKSGGKETYTASVTEAEYFKDLVELVMLSIELQVEVKGVDREEPTQSTIKEHVFQFGKPELKVQTIGDCNLDTPVEFSLTFNNPLSVPLTNCVINTESSVGFHNIKPAKQADVPAKGEFTATVKVPARKKGQGSVTFGFDSTELLDIEGNVNVMVAAGTKGTGDSTKGCDCVLL